MMRVSFFFGLFLVLMYSSCKSTADPSKYFEIDLDGNKVEFQNETWVGVAINNKKGKEIQKVSYLFGEDKLQLKDGKLFIQSKTLGSKKLKAVIQFDETSVEIEKGIKVLANRPPEVYTYEIINEFPHDKNAFTQGLEFAGDTLYESTGLKGKSTLRKVNFRTGEPYEQINLKPNEFGEGLTLIDDKVIQLTWQSGIGYVYNQHTLQQTDMFKYGESKQGWGLCNDGSRIYKSDGTEKIWILNPLTYAEEGHIEIVTDKSIFNKANELEYVNEKIYANVWQKESMMIIDAVSGRIEGVVNFGGLRDKVEQHAQLDVLNGVAYHKSRKTFFVTGKNWSKLFEVKIIKR